MLGALVTLPSGDARVGTPLDGQEQQEESTAERMLRLAREGSPVVRPQAARRFVSLGAEAVDVLLRETDGTPAGLAPLGKDLVRMVAGFDDARVRALLWSALDDADFPWRPAAAAGLAESSRADELERFLALAEDRLAQVRAAALVCLGRSADDRARAALRRGLDDDDARPRRAAADALASAGEPWALQWMWAELFRQDRFFDRDTGRTARIEAVRILGKHLDDLHGFDPAAPPDGEANVAPLLALSEAVLAVSADMPAELSAPEPVVEPDAGLSKDAPAVLGLELVSCRKGERFVRVLADDRLVVGLGKVRVVPLAPGTVARMLARVRSEAENEALSIEPGATAFFGEPGCDREVLLLAPAGPADALRVWEVSKGAQPVRALRPAPLGRIHRALIDALPADEPLRAELREILEAVGGPLPDA